MSAGPVLIIIRRPRPRANGSELDECEISLLEGPENESWSSLLRRAADQIDAGPTIPPVS